jgi:diguanylate cyclase (GGDEF)-like protein
VVSLCLARAFLHPVEIAESSVTHSIEPATLHVKDEHSQQQPRLRVSDRTAIRVVFVEDSELDAELAIRLLERDGFNVVCTRVDSEDALAAALTEAPPDIVLSDFSMPAFDGMAALHLARELTPEVPFIFVSGAIGEERAIEALQHGAVDYVLKDNPQRLAPAVRRAIEHARARKAYEERIEHFVSYDRLLDIPNRRLLEDRGTQAVSQSRRTGQTCAVFVIHIDCLALINETHGYRSGDELLRLIAGRLQDVLRDGDTLARFGDDAFAVLATGLGSEEDAVSIAARIRGNVRPAFRVADHDLHVTVSTGISTFPPEADDFEVLLRNAATAAHRAHAQGGNQEQFYLPQMNASARRTLRLQGELVRALADQQFVLHYQPKVHAVRGHITGFEALLRWSHPERGLVPPDEFIPVLEDTGLIVEVGEWVIAAVCREIAGWMRRGLAMCPVAINLSARQFQQKDLTTYIRTALATTGVAPDLLEVELTESVLMRDAAEITGAIAALKACGVRLAIDDFGTGYSSLGYLRRFPVDALKIDRTFIADIPESREDAAIAQAIIRLGHTLHFKVIAEGVETEAQRSFLALHGCDEIQGYFVCTPVPAAQITDILTGKQVLQRPVSAADSGERSLLLVDTDENVLAALKRLLRPDGYRIFAEGDAQKACEVLRAHRIGVIVADQRIAGGTGIDFLRRVKELYPDTVRVVLTGYTDLDAVSEAVNEGALYRFVTKPWDDDCLRAHIADAFRHYALMQETRRAHEDLRAEVEALTRENRMLQSALNAGGRQTAANTAARVDPRGEAQ